MEPTQAVPPVPGASSHGGAGFHTVTEALRAAARELNTAVSDAQKLDLPAPPSTDTVGDSQIADEIDASVRLHDQSAELAIKTMAAMAEELLATMRSYVTTEDHTTDQFRRHPDPGAPGGSALGNGGAPGHGTTPPSGVPNPPAPNATTNPTEHPDAGHTGAGNGHGGTGQGGTGQDGTGQGGIAPSAPQHKQWEPLVTDPHARVRLAGYNPNAARRGGWSA